MKSPQRGRRIVPLTLGFGMLAVVVATGLTPNTGVVRATTNCTYGQCVAAATFPIWAVVTAVAVVVVALLLALLLLRRRRRPPAAALPAWESGTPPEGPAEPGVPSGAFEPTPMPVEPWQEAPTAEMPVAAPLPPEPPAPAPPEPVAGPVSYLEAPEEIEAPAPPPPAPPAAPPETPEAEPDIDSLMAELDKISGEILKRTPKKRGSSAPAPGSDAGDEPPS